MSLCFYFHLCLFGTAISYTLIMVSATSLSFIIPVTFSLISCMGVFSSILLPRLLIFLSEISKKSYQCFQLKNILFMYSFYCKSNMFAFLFCCFKNLNVVPINIYIWRLGISIFSQPVLQSQACFTVHAIICIWIETISQDK